MRYEQTLAWLRPWRRRSSAWGAVLDAQHILLASLALQGSGAVRVAAFEHQHAPPDLGPPEMRDSWLVTQLRQASAQLPRRERTLALALHHSRCRQGVYQPASVLGPDQLSAEVQLEAANALGVGPHEVGFDYEVQTETDAEPPSVLWAACRYQELLHWRAHARRAGWHLPVVEPEHQAARRATSCLRGDARAQWAQSPQDWQFERRPVRSLDEAEWQALQAAPQWGALVACGAALGLLA